MGRLILGLWVMYQHLIADSKLKVHWAIDTGLLPATEPSVLVFKLLLQFSGVRLSRYSMIENIVIAFAC